MWDVLKINWWECVGMLVGFSVSFLILVQLIVELRNPEPSTISYTYLVGFLLVTAFWTAYGIKFERVAIWSTNAAACFFQACLLGAVLCGA